MASLPAPILVVAGPCGSGKTTAAGHLVDAFELSVHIRADDFRAFVVKGSPDEQQQYEVIGGAIGAAARQFAVGGYTVVLDGTLFPDGVEGLAAWAARRGVPVHYAVLRPTLETCINRARRRCPAHPEDLEGFTRLHARYADLGDREANVVDHTGAPEVVAAAVLASFWTGSLRVGDAS